MERSTPYTVCVYYVLSQHQGYGTVAACSIEGEIRVLERRRQRQKRTTEIRQEWHYMAAENPPRRARRQAPLNEADLSIHTHRLELEPCLLVTPSSAPECDLCGPACMRPEKKKCHTSTS